MYDDQVVVADSGNNRLIVMRSSGQVEVFLIHKDFIRIQNALNIYT